MPSGWRPNTVASRLRRGLPADCESCAVVMAVDRSGLAGQAIDLGGSSRQEVVDRSLPEDHRRTVIVAELLPNPHPVGDVGHLDRAAREGGEVLVLGVAGEVVRV